LRSDEEGLAWRDDLSRRLDAWGGYLLGVRGRAPATVKRYRGLVERLLAETGPLEELTRGAIEGSLRRLYLAGLGEAVRQGAVVAIRSFCEWAVGNGMLAANPAAGLSGPRPYRRERKVLTVAEVERLIFGSRTGMSAGTSPGISPGTLPATVRELRDRALLGVAYVAGLRASEIGPLEADGVVWNEGTRTFSVLVHRGKGSAADVRMALDRPVSRLLGAYLAVRAPGRSLWGRPLTRGAVRKILQRRLAEEGIAAAGRRLSPHVLRHSLATHLLDAGLDLRRVQLLMRHRSIRTTEVYLHADLERMGQVVARWSPLERGGKRRRPARGLEMTGLLAELGDLASRR
jgi:site-specific recombinase XerC